MRGSLLFIHSAGPQTENDGSTGLVRFIKEHLDETCEVHAPKMPYPEDPNYDEWKGEIDLALTNMNSVVLVGHSMGGSTLLKYLSEEKIRTKIRALSIIASPVRGLDEDWQKTDFELQSDFERKLPEIGHIGLFHSESDTIVPIRHFKHYRAVLDADEAHVIEGGSHLFDEGLAALVNSIRKI